MSSLMKIGRMRLSTQGTRITTTLFPSTSSTLASPSFRNLALTLSQESAAFQKSSSTLSAFLMPTTSKEPSSCSTAPRTMTPPAVLAKAERVSQMLRGKAPFPSRPCAAFISRRLPSLNCPSSLKSNAHPCIFDFPISDWKMSLSLAPCPAKSPPERAATHFTSALHGDGEGIAQHPQVASLRRICQTASGKSAALCSRAFWMLKVKLRAQLARPFFSRRGVFSIPFLPELGHGHCHAHLGKVLLLLLVGVGDD